MNALETVFFVLSLTAPLFILAAYRKGLADGQRLGQGKEMKPLIRPREDPGRGAAGRRTDMILSNIDRYDGTSFGQKEVR